MSMTIRGAVLSDMPHLYEICLKTGDAGKDAGALYADPYLLGQYFAAPYLAHDASLCFVACDDGTARGYIVGTADTGKFSAWLEHEWLPPLRKTYAAGSVFVRALKDADRQMVSVIQEKQGAASPAYLEEYPAHLHIDLLPDIQGRGVGRTLMDTFFSALRKRGVTGCHLGVGKANAGARTFYHRLGFRVLQEHPWGLTLGRRIA
jgi:ribosomal protein S18 acetylase RimI-like enzyme